MAALLTCATQAEADELQFSFLNIIQTQLQLCQVSCSKLSLFKRRKDLHCGDFVIPRGCIKDEISDEIWQHVKDFLMDESKHWNTPVANVTCDDYNIFVIHLNRPKAYHHVIKTSLHQGNQYGLSPLDHRCHVVLMNAIEFTTELDLYLPAVFLRCTALLIHVRKLLSANGYTVELIKFPLHKRVSDLLDMMEVDTRLFICKEGIRESLKSLKYTCVQSDYNVSDEFLKPTRHVTEGELSSQNTSAIKEYQNVGKNVPNDKTLHMTNNHAMCDHRKENSLKTCAINLHNYLRKNNLATGKQGFDKNLILVDVIRENEPTEALVQVSRLEENIQEAMEKHNTGNISVLHLASQRHDFSQQQVDVLLKILSPTGQAQQSHLIFSDVASRKTGGATYNVSAKELYSIRDGQMREADIMKHGDSDKGDAWVNTISALTLASLKFELLSTISRNVVKLDLSENRETGSNVDNRAGSFVLYNCARLSTLFSHFEEAVKNGVYPPLPDVSEIQFEHLREEEEWHLLFEFVQSYPDLVRKTIPFDDIRQNINSIKAEIHTHTVCNFLVSLSRHLSSYYCRVHVLGESRPHLLPTMFARLYLLKSVHQVMQNALDLLDIPQICHL